MANKKPMMELEQNPSGVPILSYNVPEPTSYSMNNIIRIDLKEFSDDRGLKDVFNDLSFVSKRKAPQNQVNSTNSNTSILNYYNSRNGNKVKKSKNESLVESLKERNLELAGTNYSAFIIQSPLSGKEKIITINQAPKIEPQLIIIEKYKLSTFTGAYGAGKTINTFTLLPGEKTKISIKTYLKTEESRKESSSILDSFTEDNAEEFENSVMSENNSKENTEMHAEFSAELEGEATNGVAKVKGKASASGGMSSAREEFSKNVQNATSKNANKASSKRENQVNTSSETSTSSGQETDIVREIENINVSRTMNFIFRQMNQEYITILHLNDIRIGFFNGESESMEVVTLPELDDLLEKYIKQPKIAGVKNYIVNELNNILDYNDNTPQPYDREGNKLQKDSTPLPFVKSRQLKNDLGENIGEPILSFAKDYYSEYSDNTGRKISVQGIITSVNTNVMRTSGIIVDTILGEGQALDTYSQGLQDQAVREKDLSNDLKKLEIEKMKLANEIIKEGNKSKAEVFEKVYPILNKS